MHVSARLSGLLSMSPPDRPDLTGDYGTQRESVACRASGGQLPDNALVRGLYFIRVLRSEGGCELCCCRAVHYSFWPASGQSRRFLRYSALLGAVSIRCSNRLCPLAIVHRSHRHRHEARWRSWCLMTPGHSMARSVVRKGRLCGHTNLLHPESRAAGCRRPAGADAE